jgi:hypothetical protein
MRYTMAVGGAILAVAVAGCSSATPSYHVEGKVTLDKAPVPNAQLVFQPDDRSQGAVAAQTDDDGAYDVDLPSGSYLVRILAQKSVPANMKVVGPTGVPLKTMTVDVIPAKYNANSDLRRSVSGPTEMNFELSSK